ncbi:MAG: energy-coupling factor transporter transmembrane protein EcfT [Oscillospiraceae bacterium]|nr:energy-coupling factor transporter transmembrane protein EcfT [Oscillospiraceae bacterium]
MLKDITIGQHFPGNSPVHRLDPRIKILITIAYVVFLFLATNAVGLILSGLLIFILYGVAKIPLNLLKKSLKPILPIILFTVVLNLFFITGDGDPLFSVWKIKVYMEGIMFCIVMVVRIICLISGTSLLTYTTSPIQLTDGLERLMKPLSVVKFPVHEMAMMMTIALRFIPTLIEETDKIISAQKSRGAMLDSGSFTDRVKALVPILIPLFISAFRRADELATAMECRCYHGGNGRTRLKQLEITSNDIRCTAFCVVYFGIVLATKFFFTPLI